MKKIVLPLVALLIISTPSLKAQQDPQFTQFFYNKLIMNPAYAGAKEAICATVLFRSQWAGVEGAPTSGLISADMPIKLTSDGVNQLGIGVTSYLDYIGFERNYALRLAATYRRDLGFAKIAGGLDFGFSNKGIAGAVWVPPVTINDPGIPNAAGVSDFGFDLGAGVYMHSNDWYAGVSALHLTASDFTNVNIRQARHMFFMGGYTFRGIGGSDFDLNPNVLIKTEFVTAQLDVNLNVIWRQFYWAGLSYRIQDAVAINLGMNFGAITPKLAGLQIGYAVDIPTSRLATFGKGGHEVLLRYCLKLTKEYITVPVYRVRDLDGLKDKDYYYN